MKWYRAERETSRILAIEPFETSLPNSIRMSSSLPSSLDVPKAPLGRPSSFPLAFAAASPWKTRRDPWVI